MNVKMTRMLAVFTGLLAVCSVAAAALLGQRLQSDRATLNEMQQSSECPSGSPVQKAGEK